MGKTGNELKLMGAANILGGRGIKLIEAGKKQRDQLLRALIPLIIAKEVPHVFPRSPITCGDVERFWKAQGVRFLATNAAGVLRWHIGYSRRTKAGPQITPNGVKYIEAALRR